MNCVEYGKLPYGSRGIGAKTGLQRIQEDLPIYCCIDHAKVELNKEEFDKLMGSNRVFTLSGVDHEHWVPVMFPWLKK